MPQDQQLALGSSATKMGVGLRGMNERVSQFGGVLQIRSNGKGTTVAVALPVTRKAQEFPRSATG